MENSIICDMETEFKELDSTKGGWAALYQQIRSESSQFDFTIKEAKKLENKNLNRYRDVSPYDHSRVKLSSAEVDYINASLLEVPDAHRSYILTQGPLPNTTTHFWQMVWEQRSKAVLMLNKVIEKNAVKCHQYWPLGAQHDGDDVMELESAGLRVEYVDESEASYYTVRRLRLSHTKTDESRIVLHFHYTTWPDFSVPQSPSAFLNFLFAVRDSGALDENVGPPVVHCSAGIGRSGTFCLVDSCLVLIENHQDLNAANIRRVLLDMRKYRMGLIQTHDQLRFSYQSVLEGAKRVLASPEVPRNNIRECAKRTNTDYEDDDTGDENDNTVDDDDEDEESSGHSGGSSLDDTTTTSEALPLLPPKRARMEALADGRSISADTNNHKSNNAVGANQNNCHHQQHNHHQKEIKYVAATDATTATIIADATNTTTNHHQVPLSAANNMAVNSVAIDAAVNADGEVVDAEGEVVDADDEVVDADVEAINADAEVVDADAGVVDADADGKETSSGSGGACPVDDNKSCCMTMKDGAVVTNFSEKLREAELRQRQRKERNEKLRDRVQSMHRKQGDSERRRKRPPYLKPILVGLLLLGGGYLVYRYFWKE